MIQCSFSIWQCEANGKKLKLPEIQYMLHVVRRSTLVSHRGPNGAFDVLLSSWSTEFSLTPFRLSEMRLLITISREWYVLLLFDLTMCEIDQHYVYGKKTV